jgi:hypothetical protein
VADEKNWQTVEEFIKQYKPVDEAMKELEELRASAALTTGTPANKLPTIFDDDPVYGPLVKRSKETAPLPAIIIFAIASVLGGAFFGSILGGAFFALLWPLALMAETKESFDERAIITRENQHLIDSIPPELIAKEIAKYPQGSSPPILQIAKELAAKQLDVKTIWRKKLEEEQLNTVFYELRNKPENTLVHLQQSEVYKEYFKAVIKGGKNELAIVDPTTKWWESSAFFTAFHRDRISFINEDILSIALVPLFTQFKNTLYKETQGSEQELFFDITLVGYICFFADLFTPTMYLGSSFLGSYVFEVSKLGGQVSDVFTIVDEHMVFKNKKFMRIFSTAYQAFNSNLPNFYKTFKNPVDFLTAYAQLLLRFLAENNLINTQNTEDPVLLNETTRLTAGILPMCEKELHTHYLPALQKYYPERQK